MAGNKRAGNYFVYVAAIFVSAVYAFFGSPAPAWVMRATRETASHAHSHAKATKHAVAQARRVHRATRTASKRPSGRLLGKTARLARKNVSRTGLSGAAIAASEHRA